MDCQSKWWWRLSSASAQSVHSTLATKTFQNVSETRVGQSREALRNFSSDTDEVVSPWHMKGLLKDLKFISESTDINGHTAEPSFTKVNQISSICGHIIALLYLFKKGWPSRGRDCGGICVFQVIIMKESDNTEMNTRVCCWLRMPDKIHFSRQEANIFSFFSSFPPPSIYIYKGTKPCLCWRQGAIYQEQPTAQLSSNIDVLSRG